MNNSCGEPVAIRFRDLHQDCIELAVNVFGYVIPILSFIVTTMNILIIIVFLKKRMRSNTTFILTVIACAEIINIVCPATVFSYLYLRGNYKTYLTAEQIKWSYILGKICVDMFNMFSLWMTVLLAFIRCRCINAPFDAKQLYSIRKIILHIIGILVVMCLVHIPSFFIFEFHTIQAIDPITNLTSERGVLLETEGVFFKTCIGSKVHVCIETITDSILPTTILVVCNINILVALRKAKKSRVILRHKENYMLTGNFENNAKVIKRVDFHSKLINDNQHKDEDVDKIMPNEQNKTSPDCTFNNPREQDLTNVNGTDVKLSIVNCVKLHNIFTSKAKQARARLQSDSTLDKLDKDGRRTSVLIFLVSTMIVVNELPLTILNTYTLVNSSDKPLPLSHGCLSIILLLWQFITYPALFLIYACMSKAFRIELLNVLTCFCIRHRHQRLSNGNVVLSSSSAIGRMPQNEKEFKKAVKFNKLQKSNTL